MKDAKELFKQLNAQDENVRIEAKTASAIDKSIMESVCAFANEPGLEGGYLLLGVEPGTGGLFPMYDVAGIDDPDKIQKDLATNCATSFNVSIRPKIEVEEIQDKTVLVVYVPEQDHSNKPVYFRNKGLPSGAFRRIGSTDQSCTDDDLQIFYHNREGFDSSIVDGAEISDLDEQAIEKYRTLRKNINPYASELEYDDHELLEALGCLKKKRVTMAGLLLFGKKSSLRRLLPMVRVDYIRVPGTKWIEDPDNRFTTIDMRGSLLELVNRAVNAVNDDLPKGFLLEEGLLQAESIGLPTKALREAIVNALMHRSYRKQSPVQIIRYNNRIEILNPGYSLKPEDLLGEPGSETRNPFIAAVFHETNLAETKGSGIRAMRRLLENAGMAPPTFESNRSDDTFTARLLLHHFLSKEDLDWLSQFDEHSLSDNQKRALIFMREVGAIDNQTYRQLGDSDILKASGELRSLRDKNLIEQKGKGKSTYYIPGPTFEDGSAPVPNDSAPPNKPPQSGIKHHSAPVRDDSAPPPGDSAPVEMSIDDLPTHIQNKILAVGRRADKEELKTIVLEICDWKDIRLKELASVLEREPKYLLREYIQPLMDREFIDYTIPDMQNHPKQAYKITGKGKTSLRD